jgi:hypothetical protein
VNLLLISLLALTAPQAAVTDTPDPTSHSEVLANYPRRVSDRDLAIGAGIFEASFNGGYQFDSTLGFGEIPFARYGLSSMWEVVLLGIRLIVAEDGQYVPGLAVRLQLHDLAYQHNTNNPLMYPILRPGVFVELRDRFPWHLAANLTAGYVVNVQTDSNIPATDVGATQFFPANLQLQYSPLDPLSLVLAGSLLADIGHPFFTVHSQTHWGLSIAAVYVPKSWLDVQAYFKANWYAEQSVGFVPEVGLGATIRL